MGRKPERERGRVCPARAVRRPAGHPGRPRIKPLGGPPSPRLTKLRWSPCCGPRLKQMFCFLLSLGAACGNVCPSAPDRRHDTQLLADFLQRDVLRESLKSVKHRLLIRHKLDTTFPLFQRKRRGLANSSQPTANSERQIAGPGSLTPKPESRVRPPTPGT